MRKTPLPGLYMQDTAVLGVSFIPARVIILTYWYGMKGCEEQPSGHSQRTATSPCEPEKEKPVSG